MRRNLVSNYYECPGCHVEWVEKSEGLTFASCKSCRTECVPYRSVVFNTVKPSWKIHRDRVISLEAAKLLGVPVTWRPYWFAYKFVPTNKGTAMFNYSLATEGDFSGEWWLMAALQEHEIDRVSLWVGDSPIYLVEFHDEENQT